MKHFSNDKQNKEYLNCLCRKEPMLCNKILCDCQQANNKNYSLHYFYYELLNAKNANGL